MDPHPTYHLDQPTHPVSSVGGPVRLAGYIWYYVIKCSINQVLNISYFRFLKVTTVFLDVSFAHYWQYLNQRPGFQSPGIVFNEQVSLVKS